MGSRNHAFVQTNLIVALSLLDRFTVFTELSIEIDGKEYPFGRGELFFNLMTLTQSVGTMERSRVGCSSFVTASYGLCVVISPDEMNKYIKTVIVAPLTTKRCAYLTRISITFDGKEGEIVLDHIRTVDKSRLVEYLGKIDEAIVREITKILLKMFAE
jgi:mRNA interferase MazF